MPFAACTCSCKSNTGIHLYTGDGFSMGKNATARRMFRQQWLQDHNLKDWVAPSEKGEAFVRCKICSCDIREHCADLTKHAETRKHRTRISPKDQHRLRDVVAPVLAVEEKQKSCALKIAFSPLALRQ
ncbi:hypothetical protein HPB51_000496 [Rhipicephalus microplus]|uniref:Uncharacterized protein n=1 Tax=Rhipicephalus microplus TaxID=6941 RepID=A0A9J6DXM3_RHIMP|nr:hypothetical protein HPB51_000496 [Rhipicephalus microplus]